MVAGGISERHTPSRTGAVSGLWWSCCSQLPAPALLGSQGGKTAGKGHMHTCTILKVKNQPHSPELRRLEGGRTSKIDLTFSGLAIYSLGLFHALHQGLANSGPQAKSSLPPPFVNRVLLQQSHAPSFIYCLSCSHTTMRQLSSFQQRLYCPKNLKYLFTGPLQTKFASPCSR